jgi:hypothetical protein
VIEAESQAVATRLNVMAELDPGDVISPVTKIEYVAVEEINVLSTVNVLEEESKVRNDGNGDPPLRIAV